MQLSQEWGIEGLVWLDGDSSTLGRWAILAVDPIKQICCHGLPNTTKDRNPFRELNDLEMGHWTGWLSYEAGAWIEPQNPWKEDEMATLWIAKHDPVLKFDLINKQLWLEGLNEKRFNDFFQYIQEIKDYPHKQIILDSKIKNKIPIGIPPSEWKWLTKKSKYVQQVKKIKNWIYEGDIFQANLSVCCKTAFKENISLLNIFRNLKMSSPVPFAGLIVGGNAAKGEAVISSSPERFLKNNIYGGIETRPIKGTRPRSKEALEDTKMAVDLICSYKDRAENIMIVDLLRNDLGKVCLPGSIKVNKLVDLESYPKVHHLTSVIEGDLQKNKNWVDLIKACWPGGSISGAPKLRACQRLHELEPTARGPYCGSILKINWDGSLDSNILIRTIMVNGSSLRAHAGCGIVADSDPDKEAEELLWKLLPLLKALE